MCEYRNLARMRHNERWTPEKIARRLALIKRPGGAEDDSISLEYRRRIPIPAFKYHELESPDAPAPTSREFDDTGWETVGFGSYWGSWQTDFALRTTFSVPEDWEDDAQVSLYLPIGASGDFSHPESLAYIDGEPYSSIDRHHNELLLPETFNDGQPHTLALHGWTGLGGSLEALPNTQLWMRPCFVVMLDGPTREFVAVARVALDVADHLDENEPAKGFLYNALDEAFRLLDTRDPLGTDAYYESVPAALDALKNGVARSGKPMDVDVIGVGHAHIDVAWLWTLGQTRQKVGRTFSNVLRLMEQFPEYRFTQSQPQLYKYTEQNFPEIFEGIKERVREGRWELIGGMWVEPDCNAIGAESLARQFLLGRGYFRRHFGDVDSPVVWLPDTFGYSWALPQLIKQAGMKYFITNKMSWNQYNHMPDQILWWQGIDGTKVLTHFLTTSHGGEELLPHATTYNSVVDAAEIFGTWTNFRQKELHNELIAAYGFGDGGGGPTREMLENVEQFRSHPGAPRVRTGTVREFMDRIDREHGADLPIWNGEFYLEYHRGTLTGQARTKRNNRKSEFLLHDAEFLAAYAATVSDYDYPTADFNSAWELVCLNQFHDILPGSSITAVYEESEKDHERVRELAQTATAAAIEAISRVTPRDARLIAINPTSFGGDRVGLFTGSIDGSVDVLNQVVEGGTLIDLRDLSPYSVSAVSATGESIRENGLSIREDHGTITMTNSLIRLVINRKGELSSVYDIDAEREVLADGSTGNQLLAFEDRPNEFDAWDIDIFFEDRTERVIDVQSIKIIEEGPIRVGVEIRRHYRDSRIVQNIYLYYNSKRVDFETEIEWHESHIFLKAAFPVAILSTFATYEIQWGNVERPTHRNTSWDWAKFETAAQKWGDLSEGDYGVALLNDSKYGYETKHNELRISLLKSATSPDQFADQGDHKMTYSLLPHRGDWRGDVSRQAYDLNDPIIVRAVGGGDGSDNIDSLIRVDVPNVVIETVKLSEDGDGIIARLFEHHRYRGNVTIQTGFELKQAYVCNLLEESEREIPVEGNSVILNVNPYQIVTLRLISK